jgi:hypothetical protein
MARRRQHQLATFSNEQLHAECLLELLDARRHVPLHPVQLRCGARDAFARTTVRKIDNAARFIVFFLKI